MIKSLIISLALCAIGTQYSNPEDLVMSESSICYHDITNGKDCRMTTYTITNNSDVYAYTWIFYEAPFADRSRHACYKYFLYFHGDFSILGLLTDTISVMNIHHELGILFLKEIEPGGTFEYIIVTDASISQDEVRGKIKPYIYYVMENDKIYKDILFHGCNPEVYYPESKIVIQVPDPPVKYPVESWHR